MRIGFIGAGKVGFTFGKYITTKMVISKPEHIQLEVSGYYSAHSESAADAAELPRPLCTIAWKNFAVTVKLSFLLFQMDR